MTASRAKPVRRRDELWHLFNETTFLHILSRYDLVYFFFMKALAIRLQTHTQTQ